MYCITWQKSFKWKGRNICSFQIWGDALKQVQNTIEQFKILFRTVLKACVSWLNCAGNDILQEHRTPANEKWVWANSKNIQLDNRVICFFFCSFDCDLLLTQLSGRETQEKNIISKIDYEWWCWEMIALNFHLLHSKRRRDWLFSFSRFTFWALSCVSFWKGIRVLMVVTFL